MNSNGMVLPPNLIWFTNGEFPTDYHDNYIVAFTDPNGGSLFFCCARIESDRFVYDIDEFNQYPTVEVCFWAKLPSKLDIIYPKAAL